MRHVTVGPPRAVPAHPQLPTSEDKHRHAPLTGFTPRLLAAQYSLPARRWPLPLGGALITACSDDSTTGKRVKLATKVALIEGGATFTSGLDWEVTLTQALLTTGPFYYYRGEAAVTALLSAFALESAHAHPGHYPDSGDALGQMLEPYSIDLLAGAATFPEGSGVTGLYRSAEFSLFGGACGGSLAEELGDAVALVAGSASKAGEGTRLFPGRGDHRRYREERRRRPRAGLRARGGRSR